ncbi:MAG TPA: phage holin family protein [Candidatus Limnocylindria bacterium]|nr:phage holin family protein [Candidatus Limnocylindria bacterium]
MALVWRALINAAAIFVATALIPGISCCATSFGFGELDRWIGLLLAGLVLGLVNAFVRPILVLLSAPITCATLGLFILVINALMLLLVSAIRPLGLVVDGFVPALLGAIVISIVSTVLSWILPD